jgi:hypothetical protein
LSLPLAPPGWTRTNTRSTCQFSPTSGIKRIAGGVGRSAPFASRRSLPVAKRILLAAAPAQFVAFGDADAVEAFDLLVRSECNTGVVEVATGVTEVSPPRAILAIASTPMSHLQRVLLGRGTDRTALHQLEAPGCRLRSRRRSPSRASGITSSGAVDQVSSSHGESPSVQTTPGFKGGLGC